MILSGDSLAVVVILETSDICTFTVKILYNDVNCEKGCVKEVRAYLSKRQVILNLLDEIGSFKLVKEHKHVFITLMKYADDITSTLAGFLSDLKKLITLFPLSRFVRYVVVEIYWFGTVYRRMDTFHVNYVFKKDVGFPVMCMCGDDNQE